MKFTNPYIKKNKFENILNSLFVNLLLLYSKVNKKTPTKPTQMNFLISSLTHNIKSIHTSYSLGSNQELSLSNIILWELVTMDNLDSLIDGLFRLKRQFTTSQMSSGIDWSNDILEFKDSILNSLLTESICNIEYIQFPKNHKLQPYIKNINIQLSSLTSTLISIQLTVSITPQFQTEINNIINDNNIPAKKLKFRKDKNIFNYNYWSVVSETLDSYKQKKINILLIELKFKILSELNKYVPLYFHSSQILAPSLELYKGKNITCDNKNTDKYLEYVGIHRGTLYQYSHYPSLMYTCEIYSNLFTLSEDNSSNNTIKILLNDFNENPLQNRKLILLFLSSYFARIISINTLVSLFDNNISKLKINLSDLLYNKKTSYKKLLKIRQTLETMSISLSIIQNEINDNDLDNDLHNILDTLQILPQFPKHDTMYFIKNTVIKNLDSIEKNFLSIKNLIDTSINLLSLTSNKRLTNISIFLSAFTVFLTIVTLFFTFLQLPNSNTTTFLNTLKTLLNFIKNLI